MTPTARDFADELQADADAFDCGEITATECRERLAETWEAVRYHRLVDEVSRLMEGGA